MADLLAASLFFVFFYIIDDVYFCYSPQLFFIQKSNIVWNIGVIELTRDYCMQVLKHGLAQRGKKTRSSGLPFQISTSHSIQKKKTRISSSGWQPFSTYRVYFCSFCFSCFLWCFEIQIFRRFYTQNKKKVLTQKQQKNAQKML